MNLLKKTKTYLIGHMQYSSGRNWREQITPFLEEMGVTVFNPYDKPFLKDIDESEFVHQELMESMNKGEYDDVQKRMWEVRSYDLNLVDRSDFLIAHIIPNVASWGSAEELVTAVRCKKPIFLSVEGGKQKTPFWIMGQIPHKYIYNSIDEIKDMIKSIDNGTKPIDSRRWRLLKPEYR